MSKKRVLVLGAGRGQVDLIKKIKEEGHTAIVCSIPGDYPGFALADEIICADIRDREAVCRAAEEKRADAVVTSCLDTGIAALGYTCDRLGLTGLSEKAAELSSNKLLMKDAFEKNGVSTARYRKITSAEDLERTAAEFGFPLIVKAVDLQGSRGINIARNEEELRSGYEATMSETKTDFCIVEEFIEGYECGAQAFVYDNEVLFVLPCGDITYLSHTNVPVGHYAPLGAGDDMTAEIDRNCRAAIRALGLNNCAVNVDLIIRDGKVYVIELTGRIGANCLADLVRTYYSVDIFKMITDAALGINPKKYFEETAVTAVPCYAKMLISEKNGTLREIINKNAPSDDIIDMTFFVRPGSEIRKFTNSIDCLGQIVVKGRTPEECRKRIAEVADNIEFALE